MVTTFGARVYLQYLKGSLGRNQPQTTRNACCFLKKKELKRVFVVAAGYKLLRSVHISQGYDGMQEEGEGTVMVIEIGVVRT